MKNSAIKKKAVAGAKWSLIESLLRQGITFVVGIILARLLSPAEYGQIGIIMVFIAVFNIFIDSGFTDAMIRKNNATEEDYNTVFVINLFVSCVCALIFYLSAPYIGIFFHDPSLTPLARAMSVIVIISSLAIVQRIKLVKRVDFKTQAKISLTSTTTSGIFGISLAYMGYGVWALVAQQISNQIINTISLWLFNRWVPNFSFNKNSFKELWGFGCNILASQLLNAIWKQIYQIVIGRFYQPASLGLYTRAHQFPHLVSTNITRVVQRVSYPVFSMVQDEPDVLKSGYKRVVKTTMLIVAIVMMGLFACAKPMVYVLLGEKWIKCVPFIQILCISFMIHPLHSINLNGIAVKGRSDLCLRLEIIKKCISVIPICIGIFIDIFTMLISSTIISFLTYYINAYYAKPLLNYGIKEQIKDIIPSLAVGGIMCMLIWPITLLHIHSAIQLVLQFFGGAIISITLCHIFKLREYYEILEIITPTLHKLKLDKLITLIK